MVSVNLFALVFTIELPIESAHLDWFVALEVFITAMLVIELILRVMAEGRYQQFLLQSPHRSQFTHFIDSWAFFHSKTNLLDTFIAVACVSSLVMFVCLPSITEYIEEDIALALRVLRDLLRLIRLVFLCKR